MARRELASELIDGLEYVQQAFIQLLSDPKSKQLARESCCRGLAACRGLTVSDDASLSNDGYGDKLNERLMRAFGQTTVHAGSAYMETSAQAAHRRANERGDSVSLEPFGAEEEVGGTSGMSEAALGAYREMAAASVSLGRPDVLYYLLIMSTSHPCWLSEGLRDRYR